MGPVLRDPSGIADDPVRGLIWISDTGNDRLIAIDLAGEIRASIGKAGAPGFQDGAFEEARFFGPQALFALGENLFVADVGNHRIRRIDPKSREVSTIAETGEWTAASFTQDPLRGDRLLMAAPEAHQLWRLDLRSSRLSLAAGSGEPGSEDGEYPLHSLDRPQELASLGKRTYILDPARGSLRVLEAGKLGTLHESPALCRARGLWVERNGSICWADVNEGRILRYDPASASSRAWAGAAPRPGVMERGFKDGHFNEARFSSPLALLRVAGKYLVVDRGNHRIRLLDPDKKRVTTLI